MHTRGYAVSTDCSNRPYFEQLTRLNIHFELSAKEDRLARSAGIIRVPGELFDGVERMQTA